MYETVMLALMATLFGVVLAIPLSFFGARNLMLDLRGPATGAIAAAVIGVHGLALGLYGGDALGALVPAPQLNLGFFNGSALALGGGALLGLGGGLVGFRGGGASIYYLVRIYQNVFRSIESLIVATLFVVWVGIGPAAGTLALAINTAAGLGKLCSEAIENIEPGPMEAVKATGANFLQMLAFAVVPQVIPQFIGYILYRWDGNVRFSTVLGFVGGGGIGFILIQWINLLQYRNAAVAVWAITLVVYIMDFSSAKLRARIV
ncbi:MAG: ABC transporter permease subunit [Chloroflexi bacterium]|nr:ABC transporter permease subunit [Chloroflexota bacterium]